MKKMQNIFWIILGFGIVGFFVFKIAKRAVTNHLLQNNTQHTKAVIINERNYMGNQPVKPKFSYSYRFFVNGKNYTGNAHDPALKVGDTVEVEYNKEHPSFNGPLHQKH
ncbi:hypothetical protein BH09BAC6_BH09BAC6_30000 [soil metagenome]|jgi:hypothetical protein